MIHHEVIHNLTLPNKYENEDRSRHAGMDGRHPDSQDASGDIRVGLDSSSPCWNDAIESFASFVVQSLFRFWLRLRRARRFVVNSGPENLL